MAIWINPIREIDYQAAIVDDYATAKIDFDEFERRIDDLLANEDNPNWFPQWLMGGPPVAAARDPGRATRV